MTVGLSGLEVPPGAPGLLALAPSRGAGGLTALGMRLTQADEVSRRRPRELPELRPISESSLATRTRNTSFSARS